MATVDEEITDNFEIALTERNRQSRVELQTTPTSARSYFTYGLQRNAAVQIARCMKSTTLTPSSRGVEFVFRPHKADWQTTYAQPHRDRTPE
jgi:hypothetical protein